MGPRSPDEKDADPSWLEHLATKAHLPAGGPPPSFATSQKIEPESCSAKQEGHQGYTQPFMFFALQFS